MPYKLSRKESLCSKCPLSSETKCWGYSDSTKPEIAFIAYHPDKKDSQTGIPFSGYSENTLKSALISMGKKIFHNHCTYVLPCKPYK
jgi:uracil-DNA glycosylase